MEDAWRGDVEGLERGDDPDPRESDARGDREREPGSMARRCCRSGAGVSSAIEMTDPRLLCRGSPSEVNTTDPRLLNRDSSSEVDIIELRLSNRGCSPSSSSY